MAGSIRYDSARKQLLEAESGGITVAAHAALEVGLCALSPYPVSMNGLGFQTVYRLFNSCGDASCERLFPLDAPGRDGGRRWISLERGRLAGEFNVLACSLSYEQETLALVHMLRGSGIPVRSADRDSRHPLVLCGGPVITANPEPVAPFADVCAIGDSEILVREFTAAWLGVLESGGDRDDFLRALSARSGFYVPSLYGCEPGEGPHTPVVPVPRGGAPEKVPRAAADIADDPPRSVVVSPAAHFRNMFMVEVARGCRWNCRFCLVCRINSPYRHVPAARVLELLDRAPPEAVSLGLVGANLCDHPELSAILGGAYARRLRPGVSSLRVDTLTPELLALLRESGSTGITLAPEAAGPGLLRAMGKPTVGELLPEAARMVGEAGFDSLKLYYMVGLPGETPGDRKLLAGQMLEVALAAPPGLRLRFSVNPFVPKPLTAWQDESMARPPEIKRYYRELREALSGTGGRVRLQLASIAESTAQAAVSLGDRRTARALERASHPGARLLDCLREQGMDLDSLLHEREKPANGHPWRILECEPWSG